MLLSAKTKGFNLILALVLVSFFTTLQSSSCSKNDDVATVSTAVPGTWRVSLYWDKKDETSKFSGYTFAFTSGGLATATNGGTTINGTWSQGSSKFTISFGANATLSNLNKSWLIEQKTATAINLKDDNPSSDEKVQFVIN
ncbi:hypothetical protein [Ferruginibacter profundus]